MVLKNSDWKKHQNAIETCERCPRLRRHCLKIAREKRKAFADQDYWGKPITGFGDPNARLVLVGLAPAAHGANRTGRIFTGDRSGDWLYRALHKAGFANQPTSIDRHDGLELTDAFITCAARCAPPGNKPTPAELARCQPFLEWELDRLKRARVFLALGKIGWDTTWAILKSRGESAGASRPKFGHGQQFTLSSGRLLLGSYHPSQQNTFTGKLTEPMFDHIFSLARKHLSV